MRLKKEVNELWNRNKFQIVLKKDVPSGADILGGRFALSIKNIGTNNWMYKSHFVQTRTDAERNMVLHN